MSEPYRNNWQRLKGYSKWIWATLQILEDWQALVEGCSRVHSYENSFMVFCGFKMGERE